MLWAARPLELEHNIHEEVGQMGTTLDPADASRIVERIHRILRSTIRTAGLSDAEAIRDHIDLVSDEKPTWESMDVSDPRALVRLYLETPLSTIAVLEANDDLAGVGVCQIKNEWESEVQVSVDPTQRRHGYGGMLLQFLVDWAIAEEGLDYLYGMIVETNEASRRMCDNLGFVEDPSRAREFDELRILHLQRHVRFG